jgi:hypothetical protein
MNKRQIDKRISLINTNPIDTNSIQDPEYLFLIKKTEKISIATYILTDFIPESESIKNSIKDNIHQILNSVFDLWSQRTNRTNIITSIKASYLKLETQLTLAQISGFISDMNSAVLKNEINTVLKSVDELERDLSDEKGGEIKQSFYYVDSRIKRTYTKETAPEQSVLYKGSVPPKLAKGEHDKRHEDLVINEPIKSSPKTENTKPINNKVPSSSNEDREEKVISIIRQNKNVSIKDISTQILDCSEKTIQRTLNKLIAEGKISKTGERRWARYFV